MGTFKHIVWSRFLHHYLSRNVSPHACRSLHTDGRPPTSMPSTAHTTVHEEAGVVNCNVKHTVTYARTLEPQSQTVKRRFVEPDTLDTRSGDDQTARGAQQASQPGISCTRQAINKCSSQLRHSARAIALSLDLLPSFLVQRAVAYQKLLEISSIQQECACRGVSGSGLCTCELNHQQHQQQRSGLERPPHAREEPAHAIGPNTHPSSR